MANEADDHDEFKPGVDDTMRDSDPTEAVRIIGDADLADEDAEPAVRFRPATDDASQLPHWTDPPSGEVPRIRASDDSGDLDAWASFSAAPSWKSDESHDFDLVDMTSETRMGALADQEGDPSIFFPELEPETAPAVVTPIRTRQVRVGAGAGAAAAAPRRGARSEGPRRPAIEGGPGPVGAGGRDMPLAVGIGVALAVLALVAFKAGPKFTMVLVTVVIVGCAMEFYEVMRRAGYVPATLLGVVASGALPLAVYWKGASAVPLVLFLATVAGLAWYLFADSEAPAVTGVATTLAGVAYVGVLGSFGALMLRMPQRHGVAILLGCVVCVVATDAGGLLVGSGAGSSNKLAPSISPNKTWEGLVGGVVIALVAGVFIGANVHPWGGWKHGLALGAVAACAAVLGDLSESKLKRDLGVKDMGTLLPGHGGLLDRFDGLLFALPAVYYLAVVLKLG